MPLDVKWPYPVADKVSRLWLLKRKSAMAVVGTVCKIWMDWANTVTIHNKATLFKAIEDRPCQKPLVTVSNHTSCFDDPVLWGVLRWRNVFKNDLLRWTSAASDVCFTKEWHATFFTMGRIIPIVRGDGVYQRGMDYMLEKMNAGGWVHKFPEGKINMNNEFIRLKWGVGRLISESNIVPIVIPFWHVGMDSVLPNQKPYLPRIGQKVTVVVGNPIDFSEQLKKLRESNSSPKEIRKVITDRIQDEFCSLKDNAECLHLSADR